MLNPRELDGEPHEVADEAGKEVELNLLEVVAALNDFEWAACNAWLSAEFHRTGTMPTRKEFQASVVGRQIKHVTAGTLAAYKAVQVLRKAASWNPKSV